MATKKRAHEKGGRLGLDEISLKRWIVFLVADLLGLVAFAVVFASPLKLLQLEGEWAWLSTALMDFVIFAGGFIFSVVFLHKVCKTSLRAFLVGDGEKIDWRQCGVFALLYILGAALADFLGSGFGSSISLNTVGAAPVLAALLVAVAFTWMQTTWEEIIFRGLFLRWACGNKIAPTARCVAAGLVGTLVFMSMHLANPEVTVQSGLLDVVMAAAAYFIAGGSMFVLDVAFGNLMPGCVCHLVNNFISFAVVGQLGTAVAMPSILVDSSPVTAVGMLATTVIGYLPFFVYVAVKAKKGELRRA